MTARNEKTPAVIQTHRERIRLWDSGVQTWEGVGDQTSPPPPAGASGCREAGAVSQEEPAVASVGRGDGRTHLAVCRRPRLQDWE